ncbi:hypothetical protein IEQ34_021427 [Dendrobium chrysotoxum]|uniref:Uncharacterized protein n=1 Tax=Dendrobium chrysotoxum TaxID=161865 RepID=A0AAV7FLU7_DENCH|nr:hypothetical protein IEQ34_021427 [Dendrobium chrysotoxum]
MIVRDDQYGLNLKIQFLDDFCKSIVRKDSGSLPHLESEKDDSSLPHLESEKDDGSLPHLESEKDDSSLPYLESEKDDGSLPHLEGEKDDGTLPHRDEQGDPICRKGRTICAEIQNMPQGIYIHIEVNKNNIPCNIPGFILMGSYLGVIARDPILEPLAFLDWRNKGMKPFKKRMLVEVEASLKSLIILNPILDINNNNSKFEFPAHIHYWILQSLGVKWHNHKTSLKAEYWDSRPLDKILESVSVGIDALQWCQLVIQWSKPED